jgi:hypothetical protein
VGCRADSRLTGQILPTAPKSPANVAGTMQATVHAVPYCSSDTCSDVGNNFSVSGILHAACAALWLECVVTFDSSAYFNSGQAVGDCQYVLGGTAIARLCYSYYYRVCE